MPSRCRSFARRVRSIPSACAARETTPPLRASAFSTRSRSSARTARGALSDPCATVAPMQSEQRRQSKREQRRLRREQKRHSDRGPPVGDVGAVPRTSILEVLVDYAGPLIDAVPRDADPERTKQVLLLAAVVWNAVVEEEGDAEETARKLIVDMKSKVLFPPPDALVKWLARRKVSRFGDDRRLIQGAELAREVDSLCKRGFQRPLVNARPPLTEAGRSP